ncbi:LCP family protein [Candidatus Microgenomates bacterium]|nr:LCP family protein [Candidatus Microgenomates bacterium]
MSYTHPDPHRSLEGISRPKSARAKPRHKVVKSLGSTASRSAVTNSNLPKSRGISATGPAAPRRGLRQFFSHPPSAKQAALFGLLVIALTGVLLVVRLLLTANKIIVRDDGAAALTEEVDPSLLKGEGDGRVNVLLIGIGGDGHISGDLADSIMIVSVDPISKDVAMLSVPRDLYVKVGQFGSAKINAAHAYGEQYNYPGGGPKLLEQTAAQTFGVPIHYFVRLDFEAFRKAVDIMDGIDVEVKEAINDYAYPDENLSGYQPFVLSAGPQHLDGATALKFARSRYTTSDFDRGKRQQQILAAIKDKALSIGTLVNPLRINSLLVTAGSHVRTDLRVDEMLRLYELAKQVRPEQVSQATLDTAPENYLTSANIGGASVLVPTSGDFGQIRRFVRKLMPDGYLKREQARVTVLNGTNQVGLAEQTADILRSFGYNVVRVDNADRFDYERTQLVDHSGGAMRYTLHYLEKRFGTISQSKPSDPNTDITIIVGNSYTPTE